MNLVRGKAARAGAITASSRSGSPDQQKMMAAAFLLCRLSSMNGCGGAVIIARLTPISSGALAANSANAAQAFSAWSTGHIKTPAVTTGPTSCSFIVKCVTTPKFPPPPRSPQNRSGLSVAEALTISPSAVMRSAARRLSHVRPNRRLSQPKPPPSANPPMPVWEMTPPGVAKPNSCTSRSKSPQRHPPPATATFALGSTCTPRNLDRSMTIPPSQVPLPAALWPPPRTAAGRSCSRANRTAARTSE